MNCIFCGTENKDGAAFCKNCGKKLRVDTCPECGRKIEASEAAFCKYCGTKLGTVNPSYDGAFYDEPSVIDVPIFDEPTIEPRNNQEGNQYVNRQHYSYRDVNAEYIPGKSAATASMVIGIIALAFWFMGYLAILSTILGIIGLVLANKSGQAGFEGGTRKAGFVCSLIAVIGGALVFLSVCIFGAAFISIFS